VQKLLNRLDTGKWREDADDLNAAAAALGPNFNIFPTPQGLAITPPAYFDFRPAPYLRPFDALGEECQSDARCREQFEAGAFH
jgi:hypothetical protein